MTSHSLPKPEELGFKWPAFAKSLERIGNIEARRREAELTAQELQERIQDETQEDIRALAAAIASGSPDPAPPGLENLRAQLVEQSRLAKALQEAEPQAESGLVHAVQAHRDEWAEEVEDVLLKAIREERKVYEKAMQPVLKARERRQHIEMLSRWVRTTPPVFSPPSDATVPVAFAQLGEDADRCERQLAELREREAEQLAENTRIREQAEMEADEQKGAA